MLEKITEIIPLLTEDSEIILLNKYKEILVKIKNGALTEEEIKTYNPEEMMKNLNNFVLWLVEDKVMEEPNKSIVLEARDIMECVIKNNDNSFEIENKMFTEDDNEEAYLQVAKEITMEYLSSSKKFNTIFQNKINEISNFKTNAKIKIASSKINDYFGTQPALIVKIYDFNKRLGLLYNSDGLTSADKEKILEISKIVNGEGFTGFIKNGEELEQYQIQMKYIQLKGFENRLGDIVEKVWSTYMKQNELVIGLGEKPALINSTIAEEGYEFNFEAVDGILSQKLPIVPKTEIPKNLFSINNLYSENPERIINFMSTKLVFPNEINKITFDYSTLENNISNDFENKSK